MEEIKKETDWGELNDGDEVNTYAANPLFEDSDGIVKMELKQSKLKSRRIWL